MPEIQRTPPKYLQIAGHIRDQIVLGDLRPGDEVPSEREIATSWQVARPTAARALDVLRRQGLVDSRQGSGTYVRSSLSAPRARERYERARELGSMYGRSETVQFLSTDMAPAPAHVVEALGLKPGSLAVRRMRLLRGHGDVPIELSTSWFAPDLASSAPRLLVGERLVGGTDKYIAEVTGRRLSYARDEVAARLASTEEAGHLELGTPAAVLVYRLLACDTEDAVIQLDDAVYPPDRWTLRQEYTLST